MFVFFPFGITHVLTDNGLEFTNRLIKSKNGRFCQKPSKLDVVCEKKNIEHRLTKPFTPKTNGIACPDFSGVERVNGTIKKATILKDTYNNKQEMTKTLNAFLIQYLIFRRHGSLRKELKVKTPFIAIETCLSGRQEWYELQPDLFTEKPIDFKNKIVQLQPDYNSGFLKQPCET